MKKNKCPSIQLAAAIFAVGLATSTVPAATIDWGSGAQNIANDNDVSTDGTLVDAFGLSMDYGIVGAFGNTSATVNGVTFQPYDLPLDLSSSVTSGNYNFAAYSGGGSGSLYNYINLQYGYGVNYGTAYQQLSQPYQGMLSAGGGATAYLGSGADLSDLNYVHTLALTMSGLTIGETYEFQWWDSDANPNTHAAVNNNTLNTTATAGNSVSLFAGPGVDYSSAGQYAIGTFTADAVSQEIDFTGASSSDDPLVDAFQLRGGITPVPEPSTWALLALGLVFAGQKFYAQRRQLRRTV
jgi:hypothetical protein